jgi:hypothetical protein
MNWTDLSLAFEYSFSTRYPHLYFFQKYKDGKVVKGNGLTWAPRRGSMEFEETDFQPNDPDEEPVYDEAKALELVAGLETKNDAVDLCSVLPENFFSPEVSDCLIRRNPSCLKFIPAIGLGRHDYTCLCDDAVKADGLTLKDVNLDTFDEDYYYALCREAVEQNPQAAAFLEKARLTEEQYKKLSEQ